MELLAIMNYGPVVRGINQTPDNIRNSGADKVHLAVNCQGVPPPIIKIDTLSSQPENIGNARGLNKFYHNAPKFDMVVILADDIQLPKNWAKIAFEYMKAIPNTGIIGFHCVEGVGETKQVNGLKVSIPNKVFGVWCINPEVYKQCGDFYDKMSLYGLWDSEYNNRTKAAGFLNYYIWNLKSKHLGVSDTPDYRQFKRQQLALAAKNYPKEPITKFKSDVKRIVIG